MLSNTLMLHSKWKLYTILFPYKKDSRQCDYVDCLLVIWPGISGKSIWHVLRIKSQLDPSRSHWHFHECFLNTCSIQHLVSDCISFFRDNFEHKAQISLPKLYPYSIVLSLVLLTHHFSICKQKNNALVSFITCAIGRLITTYSSNKYCSPLHISLWISQVSVYNHKTFGLVKQHNVHSSNEAHCHSQIN